MPKSLSMSSLYPLPDLDLLSGGGLGDLGGFLERKNSVLVSSLSRSGGGGGSFRGRTRNTRDGIHGRMKQKRLEEAGLVDPLANYNVESAPDARVPSLPLKPSPVPSPQLLDAPAPQPVALRILPLHLSLLTPLPAESPLERLVSDMGGHRRMVSEQSNLSGIGGGGNVQAARVEQ
ncbi:hypothetical protein BT69DRAFT_685573 [Atractiella rhizophila]|nr:hypothetical protein BT69DRAFT_685573 [Atractiella rhizophila]